jgi:hypothetical protein
MALADSHDPLFDSAWFKWAQAVAHAQALAADVEARRTKGDLNPVRAFRADYQSRRHGFSIIVADIAPVPIRWRLLLGDIANNFRASLDHLAWALVTRGRTPPSSLTLGQGSGIYFPVSHSRTDFNAQVRIPSSPKSRLKLPGVLPADRAIVRHVQPYHHAARGRWRHPLVLLASINAGDKHRTIQPVWAYTTRIDIEVTRMRDCVLTRGREWRRETRPLEPDTEVAFLPARKLGGDPEIEMKVKLAAEPSVGERISIREWHTQTGMTVYKLLSRFSLQPAGIDQIGATLVPLLPGV